MGLAGEAGEEEQVGQVVRWGRWGWQGRRGGGAGRGGGGGRAGGAGGQVGQVGQAGEAPSLGGWALEAQVRVQALPPTCCLTRTSPSRVPGLRVLSVLGRRLLVEGARSSQVLSARGASGHWRAAEPQGPRVRGWAIQMGRLSWSLSLGSLGSRCSWWNPLEPSGTFQSGHLQGS